MTCGTRRKVVAESEWLDYHQHGEIVTEPYPGPPSPEYRLVQVRCSLCGAVLIRIEQVESGL